jgi:hypothetical protein
VINTSNSVFLYSYWRQPDLLEANPKTPPEEGPEKQWEAIKAQVLATDGGGTDNNTPNGTGDTPGEGDAYQKLVADLQNGADRKTVLHDAAQLAIAAGENGDLGLERIARTLGYADPAQALGGHDPLQALLDAAPGTQAAKEIPTGAGSDNDPLALAYTQLEKDIARGADPQTLKADADLLKNIATNDGDTGLADVTTLILDSLSAGSYTQEDSMEALVDNAPAMSHLTGGSGNTDNNTPSNIANTPDSSSPTNRSNTSNTTSNTGNNTLKPSGTKGGGTTPLLIDPSGEPNYTVDNHGHTGTLTPTNIDLFPNGDPSPYDVIQHGIGDCYFDAVLASIAAEDPDYIKNMIHDNGDGTYTVHLFDPNGTPVDVTVDNKLPTDANGNLLGLSGPNNEANWASIVEKAFAEYNDVYHVTGEPGHSGYDALNDGGSALTAVRVLTGHNTTNLANSSYTTPQQQNAFAQQLQQDIENGKIVTATSVNERVLPDGAHTIANHLYSVVGVHQDANGNWYVDVRNPEAYTPYIDGSGSTTDDGVLHMSISDYVKYMDGTSVSDPFTASGNNNWQPPGSPIDVDQGGVFIHGVKVNPIT